MTTFFHLFGAKPSNALFKMKIFITAALVLVGVFGMANQKAEFALFGLFGAFVMYGGTVIYDSYIKSRDRFKGMSVILFFLIFGAAAHAQVDPEPSLSAPKFERRYSYMESRDKNDPVTYSFTEDCLIISNGEMLKIVVGDEADLMPIVGWGKDSEGNNYIDTELYRTIIREKDVLRVWIFSQRNYDRFAYPKI